MTSNDQSKKTLVEIPVSQSAEVSEKVPLLFDFKEKRKQRQVSEYYSKQVEFLEACYRDKDHIHNQGEDETKFLIQAERRARKKDEYLAKAAFGLNVILLVAKAAAAYLSGSLAVVSTVIESAVDITSGITIWLTVRAIENTDPFEYPRGRPKLEPLAIVIVSTIMGIASIQVIIQSVQSITNKSINPEVDLATILIVGVTILSKLILLVFCLRQKTPNARVLAIDQRNDVITNTFAIICAIIGERYWLLADPLGAIAVSTLVCCTWFYVAWGQIPIISGKRANREYINRVITVCCHHEPPVKCLDKVLVYHYGNKFLVEVRVIMQSTTTLYEANQLVSSLQAKLELLPEVERAFVRAICRDRGIEIDFLKSKLITDDHTKVPPIENVYQNGTVQHDQQNGIANGFVH